MRTMPVSESVETIPDDVAFLKEAAAFFDWGATGASLKQHIFNVDLWDDALESLALAAVTAEEEDGSGRAQLWEAVDAVAASANFLLLPLSQRREALEALAAAVSSPSFLAARKAALADARQRRARPESAAEAYTAARQRRRKKDFVAVPPSVIEDERVIEAMYATAVAQLGAPLLAPLGFPASQLGLRSLVGAARAAGDQRAAAALGRVWHAADDIGPIIVRRGLSSFDSAHVRAAADGATTLVLVFSSLGWNGVVRAEWGATLRAAGDDKIVIAHCLDTAQSWFMTDPMSGEYDDGAWWDTTLLELCAPYERVCILGESMGASGALRFARHATGSVVALVPQIDVRDFVEYAEARADFGDERKQRLRESIVHACKQTKARLVLHVGQDPPDLRQLSYLPPTEVEGDRLRVVRHDVPGHALGAGLKAQGLLRKTILRDLLGHTYSLPPARSPEGAGVEY